MNERDRASEAEIADTLSARWAEIVRTATLIRAQARLGVLDQKIFRREALTPADVEKLVNECDDGRTLAHLVEGLDRLLTECAAAQLQRRDDLRGTMGTDLFP